MKWENQFEKERILSVSDYIKIVNQGLRNFGAKIIGEVSEVKSGPTGHIYFSLKDEEDKSVIKCIIWRSRYRLYGINLKEGDKIIVTGYPEIYSLTGRFSFLANVIEYTGEGKLKQEYEKLKNKLTKEGIFLKTRKRLIPKYSQRLGVITSRQGAVLADFLSNLGKYNFKVKMIDSRVEGQAAVTDILSAIRTFKKINIDILVIMRGGGSLESMMAFNNEILVREIANFPVPVIAAIGHHKDVPLAALAADYAVSTPSIAATLLSESWDKAALYLERFERIIFSDYDKLLRRSFNLIIQSTEIIREVSGLISKQYRDIKFRLGISLLNFKNGMLNLKSSLNNYQLKILFRFKSMLAGIRKQIEYLEGFISSNNPKNKLISGYSIAMYKGRIIKRIDEVRIGERLNLIVSDGTIISQIKDKKDINNI